METNGGTWTFIRTLILTVVLSAVTPLLAVLLFPLTILNVWVLQWAYDTLLPYAPPFMPMITFGQMFMLYVLVSVVKALTTSTEYKKDKDERKASEKLSDTISMYIVRMIAVYFMVQLTVWYLSQ